MTPGTSDELREWRELCERASDGPWFAFRTVASGMTVQRPNGWIFCLSSRGTEEDCEFAATAREALPRCLAEIERLQERDEKLRNAVKRAGFGIMETSGDWSIHDVSESGKKREQEEFEQAAKLVDYEVEIDRLNRVIESLTTSHRGERS